jgi:hypothetical protein
MAESVCFLLGFAVGFFTVLAGLGHRRQHGLGGRAEGPFFEPVDKAAPQLPPAASAPAPAHAVLFEPVDEAPKADGVPCWICGKPRDVGDHQH